MSKRQQFALLLSVGLLVQIPVFSQEAPQEADQSVTSVTEDDPHKVIEQKMPLGDGPAQAMRNSGASIWVVFRMILVLALAAAAIYGIVLFIKRSSKQTAASDPFLKILASSHLGFNRYVHIASVGSKAWLLGASEGGVNLISEIEDKEIIDTMLLEDSKKSAETQNRFPDFISIIRRLGMPAQTRSSGVDEIRKRRERLKGL
ncbi:MAG: flagellar biosynthetic protein FliO [Spirochaetes bacterium]|nr:flagellar biosynthetic protein FliO [Spirochaetota bacterium]